MKILAFLTLLVFASTAEAALKITKINPSWLAPNETKNITISGDGFSLPMTVTMGAGVTVNGAPTWNSATEIIVNVTSVAATTGTRNVRVTTDTDGSFFEQPGMLAISPLFQYKGSTNGAGFTAAERNKLISIGSLVNDGFGLVGNELYYLSTLTSSPGPTNAQREAFLVAWGDASSQVAITLALLLHIDRGATAPSLTTTGATTCPGAGARADCVAAAVTAWALVGTHLTTMANTLEILQLAATEFNHQVQFYRARTIGVATAQFYHNATDISTSTWLKPFPDDITSPNGSTVRIVPTLGAVHGHYPMAQWGMYRVNHNAAIALKQVGNVIGLTATPQGNADIIFERLKTIYLQATALQLSYAHIYPEYSLGVPVDRPNMNPRFNLPVAGSDKLMNFNNDSTVQRIHEALTTTAQWPVSGTPALTAKGLLLGTIGQIWGPSNDQGAWANIFFNDFLLASEVAQAGNRQGEVLVTQGRYGFTIMSPPSFRPGTSMTVTITGSGFQNGMTPVFSNTVGNPGIMGVTVESFSVISSTQAKARITAASNAALGFRDLSLVPPEQIGGQATTVVAILTIGSELVLKGGFTTIEQSEIQDLYDGVVNFSNGMQLAVAALGAAGVSQVQAAEIVFAGAGVIQDTFKGLSHLIHAESSNQPPYGGCLSDGFDGPTLIGQPRSAWVSTARFYFNRVRGSNLEGSNPGGVNFLGHLTNLLTAAIASASDAGVKATLTTVRDTYIANAITKFNAADLMLSFALPFPDDVVGASSPSVVHNGFQVFTSHGCHRVAQQGHARGFNYIFEPDYAYTALIQSATFSTWTNMKAYMTEIYTQMPIHFDQYVSVSGYSIRTVAPPPGVPFAAMNPRMGAVASMWDLHTNSVDLSGAGFIGGPTSLNASFIRQLTATQNIYLDIVDIDVQQELVGVLVAKESDSWRNQSLGLARAMQWNFGTPTAPTLRVFSELPSTAPIITTGDAIGAQSGQPIMPFVITTTGTTGAGAVKPVFTIVSGAFPAGIIITSNPNGTATVTGTTTAGSNTARVRADNGTTPVAEQDITVTVAGVGAPVFPAFTNISNTTFTVGRASSFIGFISPASPVPTIVATGTLPAGVTFIDNADGSFTISGTAATVGAENYALVISATNATGTIDQNFNLKIQSVAKRATGVKGVI